MFTGSCSDRRRRGSVYFALCSVALVSLNACGVPKTPSAKAPETAAAQKPEKHAEPSSPVTAVRLGNTDAPNGAPSPHAICGHTVAFAGWRQSVEGLDDRLLFHDPGDNAFVAERHVHIWDAGPNESALHFGKRRPSIVLEPATPFTIVGAILMVPENDAKAGGPLANFTAAMPDLSQSIGDGAWPGLCGPTSAANILYAVGSRRPLLLKGIERGPSQIADRDAARLIVGDAGRVLRTSLAAKMGLREDGAGVTNHGIRIGFADWLDDRDAGNWSVTLDWLNDEEKHPDEQRKFFRNLADVGRDGGGVVLCLWPGTEFADSPTDVPQQQNAPQADSAPAAEVAHTPENETAPSAKAAGGAGSEAAKAPGFEGKEVAPAEIDAALAKARNAMDRTRRALDGGDHEAACDAIGEAISTLRPRAACSKSCREALDEANEFAQRLEASLPTQEIDSDKPTSFE